MADTIGLSINLVVYGPRQTKRQSAHQISETPSSSPVSLNLSHSLSPDLSSRSSIGGDIQSVHSTNYNRHPNHKIKPDTNESNDDHSTARNAEHFYNDFAEKHELLRLQQRDQEVRRHEQAHAAAAQGLVGAPSYRYEQGSDGQHYAVDGKVSIDMSPIANDPAATMLKMQQVYRAALAPAEPSAQDRRIAALASQKMEQARVELEQIEQQQAKFERAISESKQSELRQDIDQARQQLNEFVPAESDGIPSSEAVIHQFAEVNIRSRYINETLLRLTEPASTQQGYLFDEEI